jgi:hypothetical protein
VSLEAPPELSKAQRKRWRRRQRKLGLDGGGNDQVSAQPMLHHAKAKTGGKKRLKKQALDRSVLLKFGSTRLMPKMTKIWQDDRPDPKSESYVDAFQSKSNPDIEEYHTPDVPGPVKKPTESPPSINASTAPAPAITITNHFQTNSGSTSTSKSSSSNPPQHQKDDSIASAIGGQKRFELRPPTIPAIAMRLTSFRQKITSVPTYRDDGDVMEAFKRFSTFVRGGSSDSEDESESSESEDDAEMQSHSLSPPDIRDKAGDSSHNKECVQAEKNDPHQRPFLASRQDGSHQSDEGADESSESAEENSLVQPPARVDQSNSGARTSESESESAEEDSSKPTRSSSQDEELLSSAIDKDHDSHHATHDVEEQAQMDLHSESAPGSPTLAQDQHSQAETHENDNNQMRVHSQPEPDPTSSTPAPRRRANVGIKRQGSFLGLEGGGTPFINGLVPPPSEKARSVPRRADVFDVSELDTTEALEALDEVSENLLTATRPLPPSKFGEGLLPTELQAAEGLMTLAFSDGTNLGVAGPTCLTGAQVYDNIAADTWVCNSVRIAEEQGPRPIEGLDGGDAMTSASVGKGNYHLSENDIASDDTESSSSLSELSRTPSLPDDPGVQPAISTKHNLTERSRVNEIADASTTSTDQLPSKKRKMTGRTSKHFTPPKRSTRKMPSTPATVQHVQSSEVSSIDDNATGTATFSRAEDAIRATLRAERAIRVMRPREQAIQPVELQAAQAIQIIDPDEGAQEDGITEDADHASEPRQLDTPLPTPLKSKPKRKSTGKKSTYFTPTKPPLDTTNLDRVDLYNATSAGRKARVPAGVSIAPVPSIHSPMFGIIQEKLWREPFWLLIAVTFLNKTTGRAAVPVFWRLKEQYPTPEALAEADEEALVSEIWHLGLQRQRARRLLKMATAWVEQKPEMRKRWRTLHYPLKGDGKAFKAQEAVEEDVDDCEGALEIGHIPGCGPYAWDSWRIFCRDVLRGVADDYDGNDARSRNGGQIFVPEWKKVLPLDKELRACLRWMWLREGWIWNCETGDRRAATEDEMKRAVEGEMDISDPQERKFAAQAAGLEDAQSAAAVSNENAELPHNNLLVLDEGMNQDAETAVDTPDGAQDALIDELTYWAEQQPQSPNNAPEEELSDASSNIIVKALATRDKR